MRHRELRRQHGFGFDRAQCQPGRPGLHHNLANVVHASAVKSLAQLQAGFDRRMRIVTAREHLVIAACDRPRFSEPRGERFKSYPRTKAGGKDVVNGVQPPTNARPGYLPFRFLERGKFRGRGYLKHFILEQDFVVWIFVQVVDRVL